jgi:pyridoxal phosphate enzyme (YggS family)
VPLEASYDLAANRARVLQTIAAAAGRVDRDPGAIEVIAVTKTVAGDRILQAVDAGFRTLGENRVQERAAKMTEVDAVRTWPAGRAPRWHLVGPLQSNKVRRAVELFDVIETVDSLALAQRLDRVAGEVRPGRPMPVLLQVNVDDDAAKSGYDPAVLERELGSLLELPNLSVDGLMTVGRLVAAAEAARPTFAGLRELSVRFRERDDRLGAGLSMGMSEDYAIAVEEGATLVRIGRAIFGARPAVG